VALAALVTLPVLGAGEPLGSFLAVDGADFVLPQLALVGGVLLVMRSANGDLSRLPRWGEWVRAMAVAVFGAAVIYALCAPLGAALHALTPTPERARALLEMVPLALCFFLGLDLVLRRGTPAEATALALAGRFVVLGVLLAAGLAGLMRPLIVLTLPGIAVFVLVFEVLAWRIYTRSRNLVAIAVLEALLLAWALAAVLPIRS
jgi:hypothetical protein